MDDDLEAAWDAIHDATPPGWFVGRPAFEGHRSREWTAVGMTELECLREMARCLCEIALATVGRLDDAAGVWPGGVANYVLRQGA